MATQTDAKALTVRLRPELYDAAASVARRCGRSLNALIQQSLEETVRIEEDRELYDAATILGSEPAEIDVEYAFSAQAEVMLRDE